MFSVGDGVCGVEFALAHECAAFCGGKDCVHEVFDCDGVGCGDSCVGVYAVFDFEADGGACFYVDVVCPEVEGFVHDAPELEFCGFGVYGGEGCAQSATTYGAVVEYGAVFFFASAFHVFAGCYAGFFCGGRVFGCGVGASGCCGLRCRYGFRRGFGSGLRGGGFLFCFVEGCFDGFGDEGVYVYGVVGSFGGG